MDDALKYGFWKDPLNLASSSEESIAVPGSHLADHAVLVDLHGLGLDTDHMANGCWGEVVDAEVGTDAFLLVFQMRCEDLSGSEFHVMGHRPRGVDGVNDHLIECRAHVLGDGDRHFGTLTNLEGGFHETGSVAMSVDPSDGRRCCVMPGCLRLPPWRL